MKWFSKKIIYGCESRGDARDPYLTRYTIVGSRLVNLNLHVFHRSDHDVMHDHPWSFVSLILWRGYIEHHVVDSDDAPPGVLVTARCRQWPGMLLFRSARHIHRVELIDGKPAVTLVLTGPIVRKWGFWPDWKWEHWRTYFERLGC